MQKSALADVAKVLAYIVGAFILAALISSPLYEIGKNFADATLKKDAADELKWLAQKAHDAEFTRYFKRALMIAALLLLYPLIRSLRVHDDSQKIGDAPSVTPLLPEARSSNIGQPLQKPRWGALQLFTGFSLAFGIFLTMSWFLFSLDWFNWRTPPTGGSVLQAAKKATIPAVAASLIEEFLFRGALLTIFLRAFRPTFAITSLSFIFAAVHFLQPPTGAQVTDPTSVKAGFEMLQLIGARLLEPQALLYEFSALFLVGLILGYARFKTASLWLPIGLHAGWVFSLKMFKTLTSRCPDLPSEVDIYMGHKITEGIIPLAALTVTGLIVAIYARILKPTHTESAVIEPETELNKTTKRQPQAIEPTDSSEKNA